MWCVTAWHGIDGGARDGRRDAVGDRAEGWVAVATEGDAERHSAAHEGIEIGACGVRVCPFLEEGGGVTDEYFPDRRQLGPAAGPHDDMFDERASGLFVATVSDEVQGLGFCGRLDCRPFG